MNNHHPQQQPGPHAGMPMPQPQVHFAAPPPPPTSVPTEYHRLRFTVNEPEPGMRRTWQNIRREPVHSSQDDMKAIVKKENKTGKFGESYLRSVKGMTPTKENQVRTHVHFLNSRCHPQFEWQLAYIKLFTESERSGVKFTRSMDAIFRRVPRRRAVPAPFVAQPFMPQQPTMHRPMQPMPPPHHHHQQGGKPGAEDEAVGVEIVDEDDFEEDEEDEDEEEHPKAKAGKKDKNKKDKKGKKDKRDPVIHQMKQPRMHKYVASSSDSEDKDSLWSDSERDTPGSSVSGDPHYKKHGHRRYSSTSKNSDVREHRRRVPTPQQQGYSRSMDSSSSYAARDSRIDSEQQRRTQETEIKLARLEGIMEGMNLKPANDTSASADPQLRIQDRRRPDYREDNYRARYGERPDYRDDSYRRRYSDRYPPPSPGGRARGDYWRR